MKYKSNDVIFINQDSGYLMIDIVNAHVEAGNFCVLITGRLVKRGTPLHSSVKIEKIIKYNRTSTLSRLFTWSWATFQIIWLIKTKYRKSKLFIVSNPPFAPLIPLLVRNPFSILVFDIYPDALYQLGFLSEKSLLVRFWKKANKRVFKKANRIFTISLGMKQILQNYISNKKVETVSLWSDSLFLRPIDPEENPFLMRYNLLNKFVILYSGNLGLSSEVEILIDIASEIRSEDVAFVIIGEGAMKKKIVQKVEFLKLRNVLVLPWQPIEELTFSLSSANLAVIVLGAKVSKLALPSKLFSYLSVGAPILCFAPSNSDLSEFLSKHKIGRSFDPALKEEIVEYVNWLINNPLECKLISNNSLALSNDFSPANAKMFL